MHRKKLAASIDNVALKYALKHITKLEKLACYTSGAKITASDVKLMVSRTAELIFDLVDAWEGGIIKPRSGWPGRWFPAVSR
ncbi:MAG: hypothetical protein CVU89_02635 [Firmicutes bacterium HGW-Firmicutes-14]|nr:MAG: hypothetical protein CVU89_02635 [Firmicutes bacterium HGW-Firmicutes-14]